MKTKKSKTANLESRRAKFFLIGFIFACSATLISFEWRTPLEKIDYGDELIEVSYIEDELPPVVKLEKPKPQIKAPVKKQKSYDIKIIDKKEIAANQQLNQKVDISFLDDEIDGLFAEETVIEKELNIVLDANTVQELPKFNCSKNSEQERLKFLQQNIKYPKLAKENRIQGIVFVEFLINKKGKTKDVKVIKGIGGGCDKEALRVAKLMPDWCPAKQYGQAVAVKYIMPVRFRLK